MASDMLIHDVPSSTTPSSRPIDIPSTSYRLSSDNWEFGGSPSAFAYTPSYVGSFGSNQDTSLNWGERENTAVQQNSASGDYFDDPKYEPEAYAGVGDHSTDASPYMLMNEGQFLSAAGGAGDSLFLSRESGQLGFDGGVDHQTAQFSPRRDVFNTGSPASSNGFIDPQYDGNRSRASSVSSYHDAQSSPFLDFSRSVGDGLDQLNFEPNANAMDRASSMSPWNEQQQNANTFSAQLSSPALPPLDFTSTTMGRSENSPNKPISPPQLMIPGDSGAPPSEAQTSMNLDSAAAAAQLAINLVPATPVTAGATTGGHHTPFQQMLANLTRNRNRVHQPSAFQREHDEITALPSISSFHTAMDSNGLNDSGVGVGGVGRGGSDNMGGWGSVLSASGQSQGTAANNTLPNLAGRVYHHGYNLPIMPSSFNPSASNHNGSTTTATNPSSLHRDASANMHISNPTHLPSFPLHTHSDSILGSSAYSNSYGQTTSTQHAPPPPTLESFLSAPNLSGRSRSRSDVSARPLWAITPPDDNAPLPSTSQGPNASSSAFDLYPFPGTNRAPQQMGMGDFALKRTLSDGGRHKRGAQSEDISSFRSPRLFPPTGEYVKSDGSLAPVDPRSVSPGLTGPTRRRGSGASHERHSSLSSVRSSPYSRPSPHTSPGHSPQHSPQPDSSPLLPENDGYSHTAASGGGTGQPIMRVERPLVTTPATKTASANRRRAEATFVCPVLGCGSTFTRHFNLRGHLRSHNEERPFKCKWPGCEKGFARQHDCKRHEALHLNIRPYTCEGCQKTFARMDALNRHLRSEGGVDCQKLHQGTENSDQTGSSNSPEANPPAMMPKVEEPGVWTSTGSIMM